MPSDARGARHPQPPGSRGRVRVFLVCSGLGRTHRGYEAFFRAVHDRLIYEPSLDVTLFKGGGRSGSRERALWNLPRLSRIANLLGEWAAVGNPQLGRGYYIEQLTFFFSLIPHLLLARPDVVYFSDKDLGDMLWRWRRRSGQRFRLLFCNGGPYPPPYRKCDHVQQVTTVLREQALAAGTPPDRQSLLPLGFEIPARFTPLEAERKTSLRRQLELPADRKIVLSVSAVNSSHKRLDYLIRELAGLPEPRPYLVILGQLDAESPAVMALARDLLGPDQFTVATVARDAVADYYRVADAFVLASTREGFGMVLAEALAHGLPCVAHDYGITRFVLGEHGYFGDFTAPGALAGLLLQVLGRNRDPTLQSARHRSAFERFSWDRLQPAYVDLVRRCATAPTVGT